MSANILPMDWYPPVWNASAIPPHLLMPGPPPDAPQTSGPEPHDLFNRLKWSILDSPLDVQVFGQDDNGKFQWRLLSDEPNQSMLDSAAMQPPQSRLQICIEPLNSWWHWLDSGTEHRRPAQLIIENEDGRPVSVKQFIAAVHEYALPLRPLLLRCTDIRDPVDQDRVRFFFDGISPGSEGKVPGQRGFAVNVVEDPTGDGEKCVWIWEGIETRVRDEVGS